MDQTAQVLAVTPDNPKPPSQDKIVDQTAQVLAVTLNDLKPPNQDGIDPGKVQATHSAKIETRATLQLDEPSSSTKYNYYPEISRKQFKKWDGREINVDSEWLEPDELRVGKELHLPWPEKGGVEKYWKAVLIDSKLQKTSNCHALILHRELEPHVKGRPYRKHPVASSLRKKYSTSQEAETRRHNLSTFSISHFHTYFNFLLGEVMILYLNL